MKHIITILLLSLFFLQAVPVARFFVDKDISITCTDEDKPDDNAWKEKKETKEYVSATVAIITRDSQAFQYHNPMVHALPAPYLESFTPPPNYTC